MRITDLLTEDTIAMDLRADTKIGVIDELIAQLEGAGKLTDPKAFKQNILTREEQSTTGMEKGLQSPMPNQPRSNIRQLHSAARLKA